MTGRARVNKRARVIRTIADLRVGTVDQIAILAGAYVRETRKILDDLAVRSLVAHNASGQWILTPEGRVLALDCAGERPRTPLQWGESVGDPLCWACSGAYQRPIVQVIDYLIEPLICQICEDETISREVVPTNLLALDTVGVSR